MHLSKKITVSIVLLSLIAVGTFLVIANRTFANEDPAISSEEAKRIAEEHTGGTAISVELEREDDGPFKSKLIYEVIVETANGNLEVEIDANTGEVLEVESADDDD
ncbi:MAG: PepSY domain-containing protein [Candidatus Heimdallarchaeota archaeon]